MNQMKAATLSRFGGPDALDYLDLPVPKPKSGEVLVRNEAIVVAQADKMWRTGNYPWCPPLPCILGQRSAGRVEAVGDGVKSLRLGQAVHVFNLNGGCYAEYVVSPESGIILLPPELSFEAATCLSDYALAAMMLAECERTVDLESLYINGAAGAQCIALIQLARLQGIEVIAGASTDEKCAFALRYGANHVINYSNESVAERVLELTKGAGVSVVMDHIVGRQFSESFKIVAKRGIVFVFNWVGGAPKIDTFQEMLKHISKSPYVRLFTTHVFDEQPDVVRNYTEQALELMRSKKVSPFVTRRVPLAHAPIAHRMLDERSILGRLILEPSRSETPRSKTQKS